MVKVDMRAREEKKKKEKVRERGREIITVRSGDRYIETQWSVY